MAPPPFVGELRTSALLFGDEGHIGPGAALLRSS
jgi:hypothetical protein